MHVAKGLSSNLCGTRLPSGSSIAVRGSGIRDICPYCNFVLWTDIAAPFTADDVPAVAVSNRTDIHGLAASRASPVKFPGPRWATQQRRMKTDSAVRCEGQAARATAWCERGAPKRRWIRNCDFAPARMRASQAGWRNARACEDRPTSRETWTFRKNEGWRHYGLRHREEFCVSHPVSRRRRSSSTEIHYTSVEFTNLLPRNQKWIQPLRLIGPRIGALQVRAGQERIRTRRAQLRDSICISRRGRNPS